MLEILPYHMYIFIFFFRIIDDAIYLIPTYFFFIQQPRKATTNVVFLYFYTHGSIDLE